jgi:hypothetical protein
MRISWNRGRKVAGFISSHFVVTLQAFIGISHLPEFILFGAL